MRSPYPYMCVESGDYLATTPNPHISLDSGAADLGDTQPARTFAAAVTDTATVFEDGSAFTAFIVSNEDPTDWAVYDNVIYTAGTPDILDLSSAILVASEGTLTAPIVVFVWALDPRNVNDMYRDNTPGVDDDVGDGFRVGSFTQNSYADQVYIAEGVSAAAAVWRYWADTT